MNMKQYAIRTFGMELKPVGLTYEEEILLVKIRETKRQSSVGGVVHEPGNPIMSDIPVDEEFSMLCSERLS